MALSSATLRNEMAALTKLGLLEQPHTSAGRVPSAQGYRYYLDHLIDAPKACALPEADRAHIDELFRRHGRRAGKAGARRRPQSGRFDRLRRRCNNTAGTGSLHRTL